MRSWSLFHFGSGSPSLAADPDADGVSNLIEHTLGTEPESPNSGEREALPYISTEPETVLIHFRNPWTRSGSSWKNQMSAYFTETSWQDLVPGQNGVTFTRTGDDCVVRVPIAHTGTARFFRLQATAP